ncbi:MAG: exodeoxyribonuclease VII small subunit [Pseudomonadota bacterium]
MTNDPTADEQVDDTPVNFEADLAALEKLVAQMENGDLTLDESLQAFEQGIALTKRCQTALAAAELKVQTLTQSGAVGDLELGEDDA